MQVVAPAYDVTPTGVVLRLEDGMGAGDLAFLGLGVTAAALIGGVVWVRSVRVVPEHHVDLVERLGRYHRTLAPGRHRLIPRIEAVRTRLDMRTQALDVSTTAYTADNVLVSIDTAITFHIVDPVPAVYHISDHRQAIEQAVLAVLRNDVGARGSEQVLHHPAEPSRDVRTQMNERTAGYGIEVTGFTVATTAVSPDEAEAVRARAGDYLRAPGFTVVLRGYDRRQVDDILRRAVEALAAGRPDLRSAAVQALREPLRVRFRGYDRRQVDRHLANVVRPSVET